MAPATAGDDGVATGRNKHGGDRNNHQPNRLQSDENR
jgi:hypothetical protein